MALVKVSKKETAWAGRRAKTTHFKVRERSNYEINYANLVELLNLEGLKSRDREITPEAHQEFMKRYRTIFQKPVLADEILKNDKNDDQASTKSDSVQSTGIPSALPPIRRTMTAPQPMDHNISHFTKNLHRQRLMINPEALFLERIKNLKKLVKITPYERTREQRIIIYQHLRHMSSLKSQIPLNILKELAATIQYEKWPDVGYTAFANNCLYFILRGKVIPNLEAQESYFNLLLSNFSHRSSNTPTLFQLKRSATSGDFSIISDTSDDDGIHGDRNSEVVSAASTDRYSQARSRASLTFTFGQDYNQDESENTFEEVNNQQELTAGDTFGTVEIEDKPNYTKILAVTIQEPSEFLRISIDDYKRIKVQFEEQDFKNKFELLRGCLLFSSWPKSTLSRLSKLIIWRTFPPGTVLVREGEQNRSIIFLKKGQCQVYRQIRVPYMASMTEMATRSKKVPMGVLQPGAYFGNLSVLSHKSEIYTIVAATEIEAGLLTKTRINKLDSTTAAFLEQSEESTGIDLTQEEINEKYVKRELDREWTQYKEEILGEVLQDHSIHPGTGKWKFKPDDTKLKHLWNHDCVTDRFIKNRSVTK
ncbi:Cyclic nucleotide-binding domain-containing protein 1 [Trichoplax sp. H2]|nr:Cyclic nucleotide-binding domain-containing protein 1 [Trichoplax sp. H2]|eukprot:RDD46960.1 Cyclic nucleotide-binding domain-containing protein 1 [Trichoplax sp. H2]